MMYIKSCQKMPILATYDPKAGIKITASAINQDLGNSFSKFIVEQKDPRFVYAIARAVTADVPNKNWDYFPLNEIKKSYQTFIGRNIFLDHNTASVRNAVGKIIAAELREDEQGQTYVACLFKVDRQIHPDIAMKIENGIIDSVSMGSNVRKCYCSLCGQAATREAEFCIHLRNLGQYPDHQHGTMNYSINTGLDFTELSLVSVPADPSAKMHKVFNRASNINKTAEGPDQTMAESPNTPTQTASEDIKTEDNTRYVSDIPDVMRNGRDDADVPSQTATVIEPANKETGFFQIDAASNEAADLLYNILEAHMNKGVDDIGLIGRTVKILFSPEVKDPYKFVSDAVAIFGMAMGHGVVMPEQVQASYRAYLRKEAKVRPFPSVPKEITTLNTEVFGPVSISYFPKAENEDGSMVIGVTIKYNAELATKDIEKILRPYIAQYLGETKAKVTCTNSKITFQANISYDTYEDKEYTLNSRNEALTRVFTDISSYLSKSLPEMASMVQEAVAYEADKLTTEEKDEVLYKAVELRAQGKPVSELVDFIKNKFQSNPNKQYAALDYIAYDNDNAIEWDDDQTKELADALNDVPQNAKAEDLPKAETAEVADKLVETVAPAVEEAKKELPAQEAAETIEEAKNQVSSPVVEQVVDELKGGASKAEVKQDAQELIEQQAEFDAHKAMEAAEAFVSNMEPPADGSKTPQDERKDAEEGTEADKTEPAHTEPSEQEKAIASKNKQILKEICAYANTFPEKSLNTIIEEYAKEHQDRETLRELSLISKIAHFNKDEFIANQKEVNTLTHAGSEPRKLLTSSPAVADLFRNFKEAGVEQDSAELDALLSAIFSGDAEKRFAWKLKTVYNKNYDDLEELLSEVPSHRNKGPEDEDKNMSVDPNENKRLDEQMEVLFKQFAEFVNQDRSSNNGVLPKPAAKYGKALGEFLRQVYKSDANAAQVFVEKKEPELSQLFIQPDPSKTNAFVQAVKVEAMNAYTGKDPTIQTVEPDTVKPNEDKTKDKKEETADAEASSDGEDTKDALESSAAEGELSFKAGNWTFSIVGVNNEQIHTVTTMTRKYKKIKGKDIGKIVDPDVVTATNMDQYQEVQVPKVKYRDDDYQKLYRIMRAAYQAGAFLQGTAPDFDIDFTYKATTNSPFYGGTKEKPVQYMVRFSRKANKDDYYYAFEGKDASGSGHKSTLFECLQEIFKTIYYQVNQARDMVTTHGGSKFKGKFVFKYQPLGIDIELLNDPKAELGTIEREIHLIVAPEKGEAKDTVIANYIITKTIPATSAGTTNDATVQASHLAALQVKAAEGDETTQETVEDAKPEETADTKMDETGKKNEQVDNVEEKDKQESGSADKADTAPVYSFQVKVLSPYDAIIPGMKAVQKTQKDVFDYLVDGYGFRDDLYNWEMKAKEVLLNYEKPTEEGKPEEGKPEEVKDFGPSFVDEEGAHTAGFTFKGLHK